MPTDLKNKIPVDHFGSLPLSEMVYPEHWFDRIKYYSWRFFTPYHTWWRDRLLAWGVLSNLKKHEAHGARQRFLFGVMNTEKELGHFLEHLMREGYAKHVVAWRDDDELVSLRKVAGFTHQYHIRIFADGEVRAHYEYTPEYRPLLHFNAVGQEKKEEYFKELFHGWVS